MPLQQTGTPGQRQACQHRRFVMVDATGYRLELWQVARFCLVQPGIQVVSSLLADHLHKRLCQPVSGLCYSRLACRINASSFCWASSSFSG